MKVITEFGLDVIIVACPSSDIQKLSVYLRYRKVFKLNLI